MEGSSTTASVLDIMCGWKHFDDETCRPALNALITSGSITNTTIQTSGINLVLVELYHIIKEAVNKPEGNSVFAVRFADNATGEGKQRRYRVTLERERNPEYHLNNNSVCILREHASSEEIFVCNLRFVSVLPEISRQQRVQEKWSMVVEVIVADTFVPAHDSTLRVLDCSTTTLERAYRAMSVIGSPQASFLLGSGTYSTVNAILQLSPAQPPSLKLERFYRKLDSSQADAVDRALEVRSACEQSCTASAHYVCGPQGTGKTEVLIVIALSLLEAGDRVLAVAVTDAALAELAGRLLNHLRTPDCTVQVCQCVLVGGKDCGHGNDDLMDSLHLNARSHGLVALWEKLRANPFNPHFAAAWKRVLYFAPRTLTEHLSAFRDKGDAASKRHIDAALLLVGSATALILREATLVLSTVTVAGASDVQEKLRTVDSVVCDQAAQIPRIVFSILLTGGAKFFVQADDDRLPMVTVQSAAARDLGFGRTMMQERPADASVTMLTTQWRSYQPIVQFVNAHFYDGALQDAGQRPSATVAEVLPAVTVLDTSGADSSEVPGGKGPSGSVVNVLQATICVNLLRYLSDLFGPAGAPLRVVVLAPYAAQVALIERKLAGVSPPLRYNLSFAVATPDSFHGREADVVIFSTVRCNSAGEIGVCADPRHLTIATTRARSALLVVAHVATFSRPEYGDWKAFFDHCEAQSHSNFIKLVPKEPDSAALEAAPTTVALRFPPAGAAQGPVKFVQLVDLLRGEIRKAARSARKLHGVQLLEPFAEDGTDQRALVGKRSFEGLLQSYRRMRGTAAVAASAENKGGSHTTAHPLVSAAEAEAGSGAV
jgi:hypothetical protein